MEARGKRGACALLQVRTVSDHLQPTSHGLFLQCSFIFLPLTPSPDCRCMASAEEVLRHLLSSGTCKCGLPCPLRLDNVFNFDPLLESSHSDSSFALHSASLSVPAGKHCCSVVPQAVDDVKQHPSDNLRTQSCGTDGAVNADGLPLFPPGENCAPTFPLPALSSRVDAVSAPRSELVPSGQSGFPIVHATAGDMWHGLQNEPMQQAPPIAQHFSHAVQQIPSNPQQPQPQQWGALAHPVTVPRLPAALYESANPTPLTYLDQHRQYGVAFDSSMQAVAYRSDLNTLPVAGQFGSQYCGESQSSVCLPFSPISTHGTSMVLSPPYPPTQSHQGYPSGVYPPTTPWSATQLDPSSQPWQQVAVPLKEIANECTAVFGSVPLQSAVEPPYPQQQQVSTPYQATAMTAPTAQHGTFTSSLLSVDEAMHTPEKALPYTAVEAGKEPVLARSETKLGSDAQYRPSHDSPQWAMSSKPAASSKPSPPVRTRSSVSSCSSSSSSDSSSSVSSSSGGEEAAKGRSSGSHKTELPPLVVSYPREKVDSWLKMEEGLLAPSLQPQEELSMAVRIPLSVLPGRAESTPVSPGSSSPSCPDPNPLCPKLHPQESTGFESARGFSEELWVKIKLGMSQKEPEVLCDRHIGGTIEIQPEMDEKLPSSPPPTHVPPSRGKRMARRGNTAEKEGSSASPDTGFSPLELARMDRTLLGLRPRGKTLSYQQQADKGDAAAPAEQNRKAKQLGLRESPPHDSPLPPSKKRHSEDFEAYLPKGVSLDDLSRLSFTDGSLVWAKGKSLPFWPGMVCAATELEQKPPSHGKVCERVCTCAC